SMCRGFSAFSDVKITARIHSETVGETARSGAEEKNRTASRDSWVAKVPAGLTGKSNSPRRATPERFGNSPARHFCLSARPDHWYIKQIIARRLTGRSHTGSRTVVRGLCCC